MLVVDFETDGIAGNPTVNPPRPVGVALKRPGYKSKYLAWGHPDGNTHTKEQAHAILAKAVAEREPLLFHNAKFDLSVLRKYFNLVPDPETVEDTLFLIFLENPYASTFSLKPSAQRILGVAPEERDAVQAWVLTHVTCKPSEWGAHISKAPVSIVGPYACGDVDRTLALYQSLAPVLPAVPYKRELQLLPILMEGERLGIRCDVDALSRDLEKYEATLLEVDNRLRKALRNKEVNLDSGDELADAMDRARLVGQWVLTPTGKRSTARGNLELAVAPEHRGFLRLLQYRGALAHCLSSFTRPWQTLAGPTGRMHPEWNQVRQAHGSKDSKGTRTGRLSSNNPNFQNPPNEYELEVPHGLPALPIMRKYLLPEPGHRWLKRDYSQQELRILAHFSEGKLYERYQEDPTIDAHVETGSLIAEIAGLDLPRKYVKIVGFSMIYGSGAHSLSEQLGVDEAHAGSIKGAYLYALPEVGELMQSCKDRGRSGLHITTWGGRVYYSEPPANGRRFDYKLLNYLIQGSAADCTKEAIIRWHREKKVAQFLCTVHDEVNISAPEDDWRDDMAILRKSMESIEFDVKMLSDGYVGPTWASLKKLKRK